MNVTSSPWMIPAAIVVLCWAIGTYIGVEQPARVSLGPLRFEPAPNAVVRALRGAAPVIATVVFDDGSLADAEVAPGSSAGVGDPVFVQGPRRGPMPRKLVVFPAARR